MTFLLVQSGDLNPLWLLLAVGAPAVALVWPGNLGGRLVRALAAVALVDALVTTPLLLWRTALPLGHHWQAPAPVEEIAWRILSFAVGCGITLGLSRRGAGAWWLRTPQRGGTRALLAAVAVLAFGCAGFWDVPAISVVLRDESWGWSVGVAVGFVLYWLPLGYVLTRGWGRVAIADDPEQGVGSPIVFRARGV